MRVNRPHTAGPGKTSAAALSMITKENLPMRAIFFRDHETSGLGPVAAPSPSYGLPFERRVLPVGGTVVASFAFYGVGAAAESLAVEVFVLLIGGVLVVDVILVAVRLGCEVSFVVGVTLVVLGLVCEVILIVEVLAVLGLVRQVALIVVGVIVFFVDFDLVLKVFFVVEVLVEILGLVFIGLVGLVCDVVLVVEVVVRLVVEVALFRLDGLDGLVR